jgi:cell division protein FtsW (lipid II flippase)
MEPKGSLPCSQKHSTGPYPAPEESSPHHFKLVKLIFVINNLFCFMTIFCFYTLSWLKNTDILLLYILVIHSNPSATQTNEHP